MNGFQQSDGLRQYLKQNLGGLTPVAPDPIDRLREQLVSRQHIVNDANARGGVPTTGPGYVAPTQYSSVGNAGDPYLAYEDVQRQYDENGSLPASGNRPRVSRPNWGVTSYDSAYADITGEKYGSSAIKDQLKQLYLSNIQSVPGNYIDFWGAGGSGIDNLTDAQAQAAYNDITAAIDRSTTRQQSNAVGTRAIPELGRHISPAASNVGRDSTEDEIPDNPFSNDRVASPERIPTQMTINELRSRVFGQRRPPVAVPDTTPGSRRPPAASPDRSVADAQSLYRQIITMLPKEATDALGPNGEGIAGLNPAEAKKLLAYLRGFVRSA